MDVIERIMPTLADVDVSREAYPADWARYEFAARHVAGRRVVDCASGAGYGSWTLGRAGAERVIGVDISPDAIAWSSKHFAGPNVSFRQAALGRLPVADGEVDLVVSFETVEHVTEAQAPAFIDELARVLEPGGRLIISTPLTPGAERFAPANEFHLREYTADEFGALVGRRFVIDGRLGQHSDVGRRFHDLRRSPGLGALLRAGVHRLVPERVRARLRDALLSRPTTPGSPRAWISEERWQEAPVQIILAHKR